MRIKLRTPRSRKQLILFGICLILAQPVFTIAHYSWNEIIRPYPWYADTLAIPIFSEIFLWLILAPLAVTFIVLTTRNYKPSINIFEKGTLSKRFLTVNLLFGLFVAYAMLQLVDIALYGNIPMLVDVLLSLYLIFVVRAEVIASPRFSKLK